MIKYEEMHPGMKVYFVHHKPGEDPYVDSATITATSYICVSTQKQESRYIRLYPVIEKQKCCSH